MSSDDISPAGRAAVATPAPELERGSSLWKDAFQRLKKNRAAMLGLSVVLFMGLMALGYEVISAHVTRFTLKEQHPFVAPKPPGARSVPFDHFTLLEPQGDYALSALDQNDDGVLSEKEIQLAYERMEFALIDGDRSGKLSYAEYEQAPLTLAPPTEFSTDCAKWAMARKSIAPIEHPSIFACDAGEDGEMSFEEAGKVVELAGRAEVRRLMEPFDLNEDGELSEQEYFGLPSPRTHWLGTDQLGRDLLTRLIYGARISLAVGLIATLVSFLIGVSWGATAGYVGGKVDDLMMRFVDIMYGLPFMFLVILLISVFNTRSLLLLFMALGAIQWLTMARIVRGQVISLKKREFVEAAHCIGASNVSIIFKHLIPNALGPIIVYSTLTVPAVMLEEAFLSFLGLGVQAPLTSWGALASEGRQNMELAPWMLLAPGVALAVTLLSMNFLGDGLRDALDPQLRKD